MKIEYITVLMMFQITKNQMISQNQLYSNARQPQAFLCASASSAQGNMETDAYLSLFFPFEKPTITKRGKESFGGTSDKPSIALAIAFRNSPLAVQMSFGREYAERYDWIVAQFKDWAFAFVSSFLYYQDYDTLGEAERDLYRKGMAAYDSIAPSYHVELRNKPTVVWDFHSLLLTIHILFTQLLTNDKAPLKRCQKAFLAKRADAAFCSMRCKNQYNVYKNRAKEKGETR